MAAAGPRPPSGEAAQRRGSGGGASRSRSARDWWGRGRGLPGRLAGPRPERREGL